MRTFCISTLGCKVNQYESEQIATLLRARGLERVDRPHAADLRIINTCSVTVQAASKSRQTARQLARLPLLHQASESACAPLAMPHPQTWAPASISQRVIVTGCWATSDKAEASSIPGVSAVLGHHDDVARELDRLLALWHFEDQKPPTNGAEPADCESSPESVWDDGWMMQAGSLASQSTVNKSHSSHPVKKNLDGKQRQPGTIGLPLLNNRQDTHQRAFLKIQDGCDAHCTYCIIPSLRPGLWSKPIDDVIAEASRLVDAGHRELVLTGIFLSAYGQPTAIRRRQPPASAQPLGRLVEALCTRVRGLRRLRLSSLEPGDLSDDLLAVLRSHHQVVPHFHLPLQSGSDRLLRRMNRQYTRDCFLKMVDRVRRAFDRPALTTDIIVGFPGESDDDFQQTLDVVNRTGFIHIHAFPFSPRPGTAAARWERNFVRGPVVNQRIDALRRHALQYSLAYRSQFLGQTVEVLVERPSPEQKPHADLPYLQHGRCERYFTVFFESPGPLTGRCARVRIDRVTAQRTFGTPVGEQS